MEVRKKMGYTLVGPMAERIAKNVAALTAPVTRATL